MIGISEILLILLVPVFFVFVIAFWLWMLIDCLKRQDDKFAIGGNNTKLIWVLVIIFTGLIGALIYYFLIKRTDSHQDRLIGIALLASVIIVIILIASLFSVNTKTTVSIEPYPSSKLPQTIPATTPARLSGYFLDVFNISKGEFHEIPSNVTEAEIIAKGYSLMSLIDADLEKYPTLKTAFKKNGKAIDLTDEEALLIKKDFDGKVIIELNKNYYIVAIGQY